MHIRQRIENFFETLARKERADIRTQNEYQQRLEYIEKWIRNVENCTSVAMDSESQQVRLFKMLLREVEKARRTDQRTTQDVIQVSMKPQTDDSIKGRKRLSVQPELLSQLDIDELE